VSRRATIVHDEIDAVSLVYLDGTLSAVVPQDASWEDQLRPLLESVDTADEYLLEPGLSGLRAEHLWGIPEDGLSRTPDGYEWSAEALGEALGLLIAWTIVIGADFIFGEDGDPFGLL